MIKTFHSVLNLNKSHSGLLTQMCDLQNTVLHKAFKIIAHNNHKLFSEYQASYQQTGVKEKLPKTITRLTSVEISQLANQYGLNGRHMNSINLALNGKLSSLIELRALHLSDLVEEKTKIEKTIKSYNDKNKELLNNKDNEEFAKLFSLDLLKYNKATHTQQPTATKHVGSSWDTHNYAVIKTFL